MKEKNELTTEQSLSVQLKKPNDGGLRGPQDPSCYAELTCPVTSQLCGFPGPEDPPFDPTCCEDHIPCECCNPNDLDCEVDSFPGSGEGVSANTIKIIPNTQGRTLYIKNTSNSNATYTLVNYNASGNGPYAYYVNLGPGDSTVITFAGGIINYSCDPQEVC
jgi:hypothetical protein